MSGLDDKAEPAEPGGPLDESGAIGDPVAPTDEAPEPTPEPTAVPVVEVAEAVSPEASEPEPEPVVAVEPEPMVTAEPAPAPEPTVAAEAEPTPAAEPTPEPEAPEVSEPEPAPEPEAAEVSEPVAAPEPVAAAEPAPVVEAPAAPEPTSAEPSPAIGTTAEPSTGPPAPQRPRAITDTGKILEGVVTAVSADSVELALDDGRQAVINRRNFSLTDEEPSAVLSVGDRAFGAELAREDPKARVVLSRTWALKRQAWEKIAAQAEKGELVSGKVVSTSKKGLVVDVGVRGFVPSSHLELTAVSDMTPYVGQTLELKILEVEPRREKLVLSRRSILLRAQRKEMQELMQALTPGEVRTGTVQSLAEYGAFVDLGGVSGLVHISELSWRRVSKPSQVVSVGDQVEVKVLDVKPKKKRISLSMRQVSEDPLLAIEVGSVVNGAVTRLVDFGAFVAIGDFEGLVHLSELAEYRVSTPEEIVTPGDEVGVKILSVDTKRRRIELSIRRAAEYGG